MLFALTLESLGTRYVQTESIGRPDNQVQELLYDRYDRESIVVNR